MPLNPDHPSRLLQGVIFKKVTAPQGNQEFRIEWQAEYRDADTARRRTLDRKMDEFFRAPTDVLLSSGTKRFWFLWPDGFASTIVKELQDRFPEDKALFDYFRAYQLAHTSNHKSLFRLYLAAQVAVMAGFIVARPFDPHYAALGAIATTLLTLLLAIGLLAYVRRLSRDSVQAVIDATNMGTEQIHEAFTNLVSQIDNEGDLERARPEEWGVKAKLWARICFWLYARAQGIERFAQTQFWRPRYELAEASRRYALLSLLLSAVAIAFVGPSVDSLRWPPDLPDWVIPLVGFPFLLLYAGRDFPPNANLDLWKQSRSFDLDKKFGQMIQRDKEKLWNLSHPLKTTPSPPTVIGAHTVE